MTLSGVLDATVEADGVTFVFRATNETHERIECTFTDGRDADLVVFAGDADAVDVRDDDPIWRWSHGRMFTQAIRHEFLESGETRAMDFEWPDPEPGTYVGVATLEAEAHDCVARVEFSV